MSVCRMSVLSPLVVVTLGSLVKHQLLDLLERKHQQKKNQALLLAKAKELNLSLSCGESLNSGLDV